MPRPLGLRGHDSFSSIGPADGEAARQEFSIGAGRGKAEGFPPGALGGGVSAEAEMELADHRVPSQDNGRECFPGQIKWDISLLRCRIARATSYCS
jgi:hypothetical protein